MNFWKKHSKVLGFSDTWLLVAGIPFLGFCLPIVFFGSNPFKDQNFPSYAFLTTINTAVYWIVCRTLLAQFKIRYSEFKDNKKRILIQSVTIFLIVGAVNALDHLISHKYNIHDGPSQLNIFFAGMSSTAFIVSIYEGAYAISKWKQSIVETERLRRVNVQAQLQTLKNQVNPHFLFNNLNTLNSLIHTDKDLASKYVEKLSSVYRFILEIKDRELIMLREELKNTMALLFLLETRFGENLKVQVDIEEHQMDLYLVPLALQMLIENAIKHNIVSSNKPLTIHVLANDEFITVTNNLQRKKQDYNSTNIGLENLKSRYNILSSRNMTIHEDENQYRVTLPLLKVEFNESINS